MEKAQDKTGRPAPAMASPETVPFGDEDIPAAEKPARAGAAKGQVAELAALLDEYYELRGWDRDGVPLANTLERLDL